MTYESAELHPVTIKEDSLHTGDPQALYRVIRMKFAGQRSQPDKSTVIYNSNITPQDIPLEQLQRMITVSLETIKIVRGLPPLELPD